jgi:hypothetical protein
MNLGKSIEDVVENLCHRSFFADFTIRSPKYYKLNGQEKEAADLLVVFEDRLVAIQVKSKQIDPSGQRDSQTEAKRVTKTVDEAIRQFRGLAEALKNEEFTSFINGRGIKIQFNKDQIKNVVLIVVFAPVCADNKAEPVRVLFDETCCPDSPISIHLFTLEQFSLLLTLLDTLPDFLTYLDVRWLLHEEKLISSSCDPIDEWALITFERKKLLEILHKRQFVDLSGMYQRHSSSVKTLERREKLSYLVDRLLQHLYDCIGIKMPVDPKFNLLAEPNTYESYKLVIPYLARLNREKRSRLAEFLMNKLMDCKKKPLAFRGFKFDENSDEAYLIVASTFEREDRRVALLNLARGMAYKLRAKTVVGIAVGHDWFETQELDVAVVDTSKDIVDNALMEIVQQTFGKASNVEL